ncbi:MAG TPA: hypothetical protein VGD60_15975 [Candidatus Acidoferrales bacterium]
MISRFSNMKFLRQVATAILLLAAIASTPLVTRAGTVDGVVKNGTTGKIAAGTDVILIQLQGGMQPVAKTKTDAEGHYHFDNPQLGAGPMLIRVVYRGVNYHEPATPGKTVVNVEVYDPTTEPSAFNVANHALILQANGSDLMVGEEYMITNKTQPPVAFYKEDGSFNFNLPQGAQFGQASAWGAANMPVVQGTIDKGKDKMAIAFPFRPGESGVRLAYKVPYPGNHLMLRNVSPYATERLIIAAPPTMQISGAGISPAGQDQGFNVYTMDNVPANKPLDITVSGTAPLPQNSADAPPNGGDNSQNPSVNSRASDGVDAGAGATSVSATAIPARLDSLKWVLTGGFASIFVLGFMYLWMRPQPAAATTAEIAAPVSTAAVARAAKATKAAAAAAVSSASSAPAASASVAAVDREVRGSLDELKDAMFRLELRRQAGTIAEEDYALERARLEQTIRGLVQG